MSDKTEVVLFRTPYVVDEKLAEECKESALAAMKEDIIMDDKSNINYIHPFTHKNIMDAWNKMLKEYEFWVMRNDFLKANEVKTKMDNLVSTLAAKAGE